MKIKAVRKYGISITNLSEDNVMFSSHLTQHLVTNGMQEKIIVTGAENQMALFTLGIRMPANGRIIKVIDRYPASVGKNSLFLNPETLVIYENDDTGEIDCFTIPIFRSFHQHFGWSCVPKEGMELLRPNEYIPKDTVFADTPGVKDGNSYMYGRNANVAYMSIPGVAEDGIVISKSYLENWKYKVYETRVVEWGSSCFPINLYGPNKPFPDIGEYLREDGLLMALRNYDPDTFAVDIGSIDVSKVDYTFDKQTYVRPGKGRVVDIEIIANNNIIKNMPIGMSEHADKYVHALIRFNKEIVETEERLRIERKHKYGKANLNISPAFNKLIVRALAIINHNSEKMKQVLRLIHRKEQIDEYYAKFVIEYEITPNMGDKFSNHSGS